MRPAPWRRCRRVRQRRSRARVHSPATTPENTAARSGSDPSHPASPGLWKTSENRPEIPPDMPAKLDCRRMPDLSMEVPSFLRACHSRRPATYKLPNYCSSRPIRMPPLLCPNAPSWCCQSLSMSGPTCIRMHTLQCPLCLRIPAAASSSEQALGGRQTGFTIRSFARSMDASLKSRHFRILGQSKCVPVADCRFGEGCGW